MEVEFHVHLSKERNKLLLPRTSKYPGRGRRVTLYTRCDPLLHHAQAHHKILLTDSTLRACLSHHLYPLWDSSLLIVKNILLIFDSNEYTASLQPHALVAACPQLHQLSSSGPKHSARTWNTYIATRLMFPWLNHTKFCPFLQAALLSP